MDDYQKEALSCFNTPRFPREPKQEMDIEASDKLQTNPSQLIEKTFSRLAEIKESLIVCEKKANTAMEKAHNAYMKDVGFWHRTTPAIEALQWASQSLGESQLEVIKTQKLLFDQQTILAESIKKIFALSACNIAATRIAVKEIKMRLENASEEEISLAAQTELENVVIQLKRQLDVMEQQERAEKRISQIEEAYSFLQKDFTQYQNENKTFFSCTKGKMVEIETSINTLLANGDRPKKMSKQSYFIIALFVLQIIAMSMIYLLFRVCK